MDTEFLDNYGVRKIRAPSHNAPPSNTFFYECNRKKITHNEPPRFKVLPKILS
jgi:hypothetical protein